MFAKTRFLFVLATAALLQRASGVIIFSDDFESNTMDRWTATAGSPLETSNLQNIEPINGSISAYMNTSIDRMHHNLIDDNAGSEVFGHATFTCWIYDPGPSPTTRVYNEVRSYSGAGLPNGDIVPDGTLSQLLAIGKYNTVTLFEEVYDPTKYQGRIAFGSPAGWFNLNGPGAPSRSVGWHKFDIERLEDELTMNFYVDNILARSFTGSSLPWDTVILGPGLGSTVGDAWIDGMMVYSGPPIPEPSSAVSALLAATVGSLHRRRR